MLAVRYQVAMFLRNKMKKEGCRRRSVQDVYGADINIHWPARDITSAYNWTRAELSTSERDSPHVPAVL